MPSSILQNKKNTQRGFTMYFAVLYSSLLLLVGVSILNRTMKEFQLTSSIQESQRAFYAADSGIDCAVYWDARYGIDWGNTVSMDNIRCQGNTGVSGSLVGSGVLSSPAGTYTISRFQYNLDGKLCTTVEVEKRKYDVVVDGTPTQTIATIVRSTGNNLACNVTSPRKLERGLVMQY